VVSPATGLLDRLEEFYSRSPPDLELITDLNKRHFRFLLPNGRFFKVKDIVRSSRDLQKWLVKMKPLDIYYSTSTYLNPTSVAPRPKKSTDYWGPGNVVLSHDVAFDIDRQPLSLFNLERARKEAVHLYDFLTDRNYPLKYVAFSGSKGFHLIFEDVDNIIEPDFRIRERAIILRRKALVDEVIKEGIEIDKAVTVDTRRIIRLPGTINSKTGYCCHSISLEQLHSPLADWIETIPRLEEHKDIPLFKMRPLLKRKHTTKPAIAEHGAEYGYTTYITSSVLGTKGRHAVLISLPKSSQEKAVHILRQVQTMYDLTDFYLFELPRAFQAICLKTVQRNRYQKILDSARSPSAHQLMRYDRVSLRMGPLVNRGMQVMEPPARFMTYLECPPEAREGNFVSQGHINFLMRHGLTPLQYPNVHGNGDFQLVDAEIRL
jgi:DNA primase catalytic subunit